MADIDTQLSFRDAAFFESFATGTIFHLKFIGRTKADESNPFSHDMLGAYLGRDGENIVMTAGFGKVSRVDPATILDCAEISLEKLARIAHDLQEIIRLSTVEQENGPISALRAVNRLRGVIQCNPPLLSYQAMPLS